MTVKLKQLTYEQINASPEIQAWLAQFGEDRTVATEMLLRLRFVSRDTYAEWLKSTIGNVCDGSAALFAVRKFASEVQSVWDERGRFLYRPAEALGSEDFIQSVVANFIRDKGDAFLDHPDLERLGEQKVHQWILVDDSIGSGKRVRDYIKLFFNHKTIRSWWSFGRFRIIVVALARILDSDAKILAAVPGSSHGIRVYPKKDKVRIVSHMAYAKDNLFQRWGSSLPQILQLCIEEKRVPKSVRKGFGKTMANIVFYHSVPNNLPGVLWCQTDDWDALFPSRSLPSWLPELLGDPSSTSPGSEPRATVEPQEDAVLLLRLIKRGIREESSLGWHLGLDRHVIRALLHQLRTKTLLTTSNRITKAGRSFLANATPTASTSFDQSLYIPQTWCADRETTQPSGVGRESVLLQAESDVGLLMSDGEVGQTSLEKTDAKTAAPSLGVIPDLPAESETSRNGHDAHGPSGPKE